MYMENEYPMQGVHTLQRQFLILKDYVPNHKQSACIEDDTDFYAKTIIYPFKCVPQTAELV